MTRITFAEYQIEARKTAVYPNIGDNFVYPAIGLGGEAGEVLNKVQKILRDRGGKWNDEDRNAVIAEMGDVLWYLANLAEEFDVPLEEVAFRNLYKLKSRKDRGKLHGEGDTR